MFYLNFKYFQVLCFRLFQPASTLNSTTYAQHMHSRWVCTWMNVEVCTYAWCLNSPTTHNTMLNIQLYGTMVCALAVRPTHIHVANITSSLSTKGTCSLLLPTDNMFLPSHSCLLRTCLFTREVVHSPSLVVFKSRVDVALGTWLSGGCGSVRFTAGLDDL